MMELFLVAQPFTVTMFLFPSLFCLLPVTELWERNGLARIAMFCISYFRDENDIRIEWETKNLRLNKYDREYEHYHK